MFHKETSLVLKLIKELNEFVKEMSRIELEKMRKHVGTSSNLGLNAMGLFKL